MRLSPEKRKAIQKLAVADYSSALLAWMFFFPYRQDVLGNATFFEAWSHMSVKDLVVAFIAIPAGWLFLYLLSGTYFDLYRKSRLHEVNRTIVSCIIGSIVIALAAFANDGDNYSYFIRTTGRYMLIHTLITLTCRLLVFRRVKRNLIRGKVGFRTLIIGGNAQAIDVYHQLTGEKRSSGNIFVGFIYSSREHTNGMSAHLPQLGHLSELETIIDTHRIEEVIIAVDSSEHHLLENILTRLCYRPVMVKILPDLYDIISGSVKTSNVYDAAFIHIHPDLMPDWQRVCKRTIDIVASLLAMIVLSPLYLFAAIQVRRSSPGSVFYKQQRIGRFGKPFFIYKFRSMVMDAERDGPALSSDDDPRITPWGRIMRKWRIDELPQFYNILKGDMSLVGPRPERLHFINIISQTHPHYKYLHKVKPGITSWGMVKYGYASRVEEMIQRMRYDLLYIENCSLLLDAKIMLYTFLVIFQGRGK